MNSLFKKLTDVKTSSGNSGERPKVGKVWALVKSTRFWESSKNRTNYAKVSLEVAAPLIGECGISFGEEGYSGNNKGDIIDILEKDTGYDFLASFMKGYTLKSLYANDSALTKDTVAEPDKMSEDDFRGVMCAAFGINEEGESTGEEGMFNGQVFLEINTARNPAKPDKNGNVATDDEGNVRMYINSYIKRRVPFCEVAEKLDENDIKRLFGTQENYQSLLADDTAQYEGAH